MTWVKGQSGNPGGRARRGESPTAELRRILRDKDEDGVRNSTLVAMRLLSVALNGNVEALRYCFDRIDGKPLEQLPDQGQDRVTNVYIDGMKLGERPPREPPETEGPA